MNDKEGTKSSFSSLECTALGRNVNFAFLKNMYIFQSKQEFVVTVPPIYFCLLLHI